MDLLPPPPVDSPKLHTVPSPGPLPQHLGLPTLEIVAQASAAPSTVPILPPASKELESVKSRAGLHWPVTCVPSIVPEPGQPQFVAGPIGVPLLPLPQSATLGRMPVPSTGASAAGVRPWAQMQEGGCTPQHTYF